MAFTRATAATLHGSLLFPQTSDKVDVLYSALHSGGVAREQPASLKAGALMSVAPRLACHIHPEELVGSALYQLSFFCLSR